MEIILPSQSKQKYVLDLLKQQSIIGDTDFVSLSVYLNTLSENKREENWLNCAYALENLSNDKRIKVLSDVLKFPITVDQVISFIQLMADEGWNQGDIPSETDKEKDLFLVIDTVLPIFKSSFRQWIEFEKSDLSKLSVLDHFYDYPIQERLNKSNGLNLIKIEEKDVKKSLRYASNPRSEIQAAIQYIVNDDLAYCDQSIVCLDKNMMDQAEVFLNQYGVDYQKVGGGIKHPALKLFRSLVEFKQNPTLESFIQILHNDVVLTKFKLELINYCEVFNPSLDDLRTELHHISDAFYNELLKSFVSQRDFEVLEKHAEEALSELRWIITDLNQERCGIIDFVSSCFEAFTKLIDVEKEDQVSALYVIKEFLESSNLENIDQSERKVELLLYALDKLVLKEKSKSGLILTDLKNALIPGLKRQIWLGCTQKNYPQIENFKGLFDLDYLKKIKGFDLAKRYDYHMGVLDHNQKISDEIIYSYSIGSYDGKAQKMPFELENILQGIKQVSWDLIERETEHVEIEHQLDEDLSQSLMMKNGLRGSITSFETYTHCPYKYFLQRGLSLYEKPSYKLDAALLGNITHSVLEHAIKDRGCEYALMGDTKLIDRIKPYIEAVACLYPDVKEELKLIEFKLIETLKLSLEFLADWERHKDLSPTQLEHEFKDDFVLNNGQSLQLKGKIDRIDESEPYFSVIDYKSSAKSFSEKLFMAGLQLQLATYIWAYLKEDKKAVFAGYFSQKPVRIEITTKAGFNEASERQKKRQLKGILFNTINAFDDDAFHINQLKIKEEVVYTTDAFDEHKVLEHLKVIYTKLYEDIKKGDIHKQNSDHSCQYCDYQHFCQFSGNEIQLKKINKNDSKIRKVAV